ncbi:MAG: tetratricopeptide repeat protein [Bryobacterales bacterium]|nr:tetratricopeptide repeat protein [Bryobacterales bacterium]
MKLGRNDACPCGSGRKYKKCCQAEAAHSRRGQDPGLVFAQALQEHQQGRLEGAERLCGQVLAADPRHAGALHLRGLLAVQAGRHDRAAELIREAIVLHPGSAQYHANLGVALERLELREEAASECIEALRLSPDFLDALCNLGAILCDLGRPEEALPHLEKAAALAPRSISAVQGCAHALSEMKRWAEAAPHFARWAALDPDNATTRLKIGDCYWKQGLWQVAAAHYSKALELKPGSVEAANNLAVCFGEEGRSVEALAVLREAVRLNPDSAAAWANLGCTMRSLGQEETGLRCLDFAIALNSTHVNALWNRSLSLLALGRMAEGWAEYEWGWKTGTRKPERPCGQPRWDGSDPAGKTILVWMEQGLGDHIVFSSMLPDLLRAGAHCIVECQPRLVTLFERSFPGAEVVPQTVPPHPRTREPGIDLQIPAASLARWFRPSLESFPKRRGFLVPDPARVARWRDRIGALGPGLKVGICWRSMANKDARSLDSTQLSQWGPILTVPGAHFVNLQYDRCDEELREAERRFGTHIHVWDDMDLKDDQEGVAALIPALDLVLSAFTAVAQMAGAVGAPAWVLSHRGVQGWWGLGTDYCPWHPSVRFFPCEATGTWEPVIETMASELRRPGTIVSARHG